MYSQCPGTTTASTSQSPRTAAQQDLTTIFDAHFTIVFVEDNSYPNSVDNNNHAYRFEVHSDMSTSDLLAALNDPAFTRFGLTVPLTATQVVVTTPPPASVTAGGTFSFAVTAEDNAGNVDTTYNGPVMLILNGGDATATLGGTLVDEPGQHRRRHQRRGHLLQPDPQRGRHVHHHRLRRRLAGVGEDRFHHRDLNSIFASRFTLVFVEDNSYPNSVYGNHHQYRFEVPSDTSTSTLLASLSDPAFA